MAPTFFEMLGVAEPAPEFAGGVTLSEGAKVSLRTEVQSSFRQLSRLLHPDKQRAVDGGERAAGGDRCQRQL